MDDLATGAYNYLVQFTDILSVIGKFPADDPNNPNVPWIFVRNLYTRMEGQSIAQGSQAVAVNCVYSGPSGTPMVSSTARFSRLEIDIWVDPLRDQYGNQTALAETENRGNYVFSIIDGHLHRANQDPLTELWGDLVTTSCDRLTDPVWTPVPDGDGLIMGVTYYAVTTFGNTTGQIMVIGSGDSGGGSGG